jgi:hypothetical protein
MTPQAELTLLETAYTSLLTGNVQSYTINGKQVTRLDFAVLMHRMDQLRAQIARATNGGAFVAQFRNPE